MTVVLIDGVTVDLSEKVKSMISKKEVILVRDGQIIEELLMELNFQKFSTAWHKHQNFVEIDSKDRDGCVSINGHKNYFKDCFYVTTSIYEKYKDLILQRFNAS